ncbi:MAG: peptidoglycan DD-metalloendopeptidase family protein, partial [Solirubrobacterales bacterium]
GNKAADDRKLVIKPKSAIKDPGSFKLKSVSVKRKKYFVAGPEEPAIKYLFEAEEPADLRIDLISKETGETVRSIAVQDAQPFAAGEVIWDGRKDEGGKAPSDEYKVRVGLLSGGGGSNGARPEFGYYAHKFPVRGKHSYGDGLGAGRNHQGQDVFAKCGNRIVAARGGKVIEKAFNGRAGYIIVIDGAKTGRDYVYYHLRKKGRPKKGERVDTGEQIGLNSNTGNASGCHLHFEMWSKPGWFTGGKVLNPTPKLRAWDKYS